MLFESFENRRLQNLHERSRLCILAKSTRSWQVFVGALILNPNRDGGVFSNIFLKVYSHSCFGPLKGSLAKKVHIQDGLWAKSYNYVEIDNFALYPVGRGGGVASEAFPSLYSYYMFFLQWNLGRQYLTLKRSKPKLGSSMDRWIYSYLTFCIL